MRRRRGRGRCARAAGALTVVAFEVCIPIEGAVQVWRPGLQGVKPVDCRRDPARAPGEGAAQGEGALRARARVWLSGACVCWVRLRVWVGAGRQGVGTANPAQHRAPARGLAWEAGSSACPKSDPSAITGREKTTCRGLRGGLPGHLCVCERCCATVRIATGGAPRACSDGPAPYPTCIASKPPTCTSAFFCERMSGGVARTGCRGRDGRNCPLAGVMHISDNIKHTRTARATRRGCTGPGGRPEGGVALGISRHQSTVTQD